VELFGVRLGLFFLATLTAAGGLAIWATGGQTAWLAFVGILGMLAVAAWTLGDKGAPDDTDDSPTEPTP
jgi:hypothetical protein